MTASRRPVAFLAAAVLCAGLLPVGARPAAAQPAHRESAASRPGTLHLQTVPALAGVAVKVDGAVAVSDPAGRIAVRVNNFIGLDSRLTVPETRITPDRTVVFDRFRGSLDSGVTGKAVELGLRTSRLVSWRFVDRFGNEVPSSRVQSMRLRSNTGEIIDGGGPSLDQPQWVLESRTQQGPAGLVSKRLYYVVDSAIVGGSSVVNRAQQRFVPWDQVVWLVQLLFFKVTFSATDLFFTEQVGRGILLSRPDGTVDRLPFNAKGEVAVPDLPRGTYSVKTYGGGVSFARPVSISKDQTVGLSVVSSLDLVLIGGTLLSAALGLILLGRPQLRPGQWRSSWRRRRRTWPFRLRTWPFRLRTWPFPRRRRPEPEQTTDQAPARGRATVAVGLLIGLLLAPLGQPQRAHAHRQTGPVPVLAYYYIWFNPTSWNRAKIDYPLLGRYSSDDEEIMRRHVRMAKAAGIDGFLVSWKHTPQLDQRLATLVSVARAERFHLGIVYQGLDFEREPLPVETVAADLALFADTYATDAVFDLFGKPLVIWSGTERFDRAQIESTSRGVRGRLLLLGDAKTVEAAELTGPVLDGQAYYWSSVDPLRGGSREKLAAMSRAVHRSGGLWVAPAAPGFDARLVGGARAVPRRDGQTLRASFEAARSSEPDAVGVISFNEFSENTHIEPSERYGTTDINVLADLLGARADISMSADSSASDEDHWGLTSWGALLLIGGAAALLPVLVALGRRRRLSAAVDRELEGLRDSPAERP